MHNPKVLTVWSVDYLQITTAVSLERRLTTIVFVHLQTCQRQMSKNLCAEQSFSA